MLVEFIIPTHYRIEPLRCMLASLMAQTDPDWHAHVIIDKDDSVPQRDITRMMALLISDKIEVSFTDQRYNDFGHTLRERGKNLSKADYIVMTGDDNYYTPNFVEELRRASERDKPGLIYWDMVHSHYGYNFFKCQLGNNQIDMGAFATRNDLAKQITLGKEYDADGRFVVKYLEKFSLKTTYKINKVLFVHN